MTQSLHQTIRRARSKYYLRDGKTARNYAGRYSKPVCGVAIAWATGIALGLNAAPDGGPGALVAVFFSSLLIIASVFFRKYRGGLASRLMILITTILLGSFHAHSRHHNMNRELTEVSGFGDGGIVRIEGTIDSHPINERQGYGLLGRSQIDRIFQTVRVRDVCIRDMRTKESIKCSSIRMKIPTARDEVIGIMPGDRFSSRARILSTKTETNPGCQRTGHIEPILMVDHATMIDVIQRGQISTRLNVSEMHQAWKSIVSESLRSSTGWFTDSDERQLMGAIVLGERSGYFESLSQPYRRTGTAHYLAVSGFAIGVLAAIPATLMRGHGRITRAFITFVFLVSGMFAIDLRAPAIRSGGVIMLATVGVSLGREWSRIGLLAFTSIVMLAINPEDIINPGFQLSFIVVASLMTLTSRMSCLIPMVPGDSMISRGCNLRFTRDLIACGTIAWLTSFPLVLHHFGIISPIGIIASITVMPFMAIMISSSIVAIMTHLIFPSLSWIPGSFAAGSMKSIEWLIGLFDSIPGSFMVVTEWSLLTMIAFEILIWRWVLHIGIRERFFLTIFTVMLMVFVMIPSSDVMNKIGFRLVTMDMGNGTCHLIMSGQSSFLFDGGSLDRRSCGRNIILPVLKRHGIKRLDGIIISHANVDHFSGLAEIIGRIPIGSFIIGESFHAEAHEHPQSASGRMLQMIESWRVPYSIVAAESTIETSDLTLMVHHPPEGMRYHKENDNSLVVSVSRPVDETGDAIVLFTGDIEQNAMTDILADLSGIPHPRILEAPHHGSVRRSSEDFIASMNPDVLIQSTGWMRLRRDLISEIIKRHPTIIKFDTASNGSILIDAEDTNTLDVVTTLERRSEPY